ncbi:hypothetical protein [Streptomyces iconiensis]|uniref:Uncharacterized protein n=1 Tax=Streptomyces iconiensis TaxID=1384038 RepID=A0ABT7AA95_9ACTN|nr:hypothetical protein [Streptomyces iconiensis]MDJ1138274.1 hypothetical protein [Streptomyces iconiensis]
MAATPKDHVRRLADADGAFDTLSEGLELHGIRLPSLGMDLATLADTQEPARPVLIQLGAVSPETARRLGKALLLAHSCVVGREWGAP